jgi:hypothetical protein
MTPARAHDAIPVPRAGGPPRSRKYQDDRQLRTPRAACAETGLAYWAGMLLAR